MNTLQVTTCEHSYAVFPEHGIRVEQLSMQFALLAFPVCDELSPFCPLPPSLDPRTAEKLPSLKPKTIIYRGKEPFFIYECVFRGFTPCYSIRMQLSVFSGSNLYHLQKSTPRSVLAVTSPLTRSLC